MFQPVIHASFLFELKAIREVCKKIDEKYQKLTVDIIKEKNINRDDRIKEIKELAKQRNEARQYQLKLQGTFYDFKLMESFLEGAPQSILQLVIIFQDKHLYELEWFSIFNIGLSFISFTKTACEVFNQHPTQVNHIGYNFNFSLYILMVIFIN